MENNDFCVKCGNLKPVCCDPDGEPYCTDCCPYPPGGRIYDGKSVAGGTFERMD